MAKKYYPFDSRLEHRAAGSAALTSTTTLADKDQKAATRTEFLTIAVVESIDVANGDEKYTLVAELSNDDFTTVNAVGGILEMGDATQLFEAADTAAGDKLELRWTTEVAGETFRYWRIRLVVAGTSPSIGLHCYSTIPQ